MAACKSEYGYGLLDLPAELLDIILSCLPHLELMNVRKTCAQFEDSFQRLICRKGSKLDFSRCFRLQEEDLMQLLRLGRDYITSVNINHCYWLKTDCLKLITRLPKLQELHVIDCGISTLLIKELIPVKLRALSISWSSITGPRFMVDDRKINEGYASKLFGNLKQLTINVSFESEWDQSDFINDIVHAVLRHCLQLESLKVYESSDWSHIPSFLGHPSFDSQQGLLPNLSKLHLHLNLSRHNYYCVIDLVMAIFRQRKTLLNQVCLGKASYSLIESRPELAQLILPCIIIEEIPVVCLDSHDSRCPELAAIPKIWLDRKTPKCRVVSLKSLSLKSMSATSNLVAELGPQLQELNLKNCQVDISDLSRGLTSIAKHCTRLIKLDLSLHSSIVTNSDSNNELLIAISEFKALKVLYMSVGLLIRSNNMPNVASVSGHQKSRIGSISEESMRSSPMWRLTQCCTEIKDFRITNDRWVNDSVVCESAIACISNWKDLKELHLVNIPTVGRGSFLPFITKNCSKLTDLYLGNVCRQGTCNYTRALIDSLSYATAVKDLSVIQDMELSSMLSTALGNCKSLERVYLKHLVIKPQECNGFIKLLLGLPKLVLVSVKLKSTTMAVVKSIVGKLKGLRTTRPAFSYSFDNKTVITPRRTTTKSYRSIGDHWPQVHLELACYKTACQNSSVF